MTTRMIFSAIVCCFLISSVLTEKADPSCTLPDDAPADLRLRNDIFCKYDRFVRPRINLLEYINVTIRLDLKYISISDFHNIAVVHTWFQISWTDIFARWEPKEYDGIEHFVIPPRKTWVPDLVVYNSDSSSQILFQNTPCVIYKDGEIVCTPEISAPLYCNFDLIAWPYDIQNCSMIVGSWAWGYQLNIIIDSKNAVNLNGMTQNNYWKLKKAVAYKNYYGAMEFDFIMQRHAAMHVASVVVPAFAISGLTLSSFWVQHGITRLSLCCIACLTDALFLQYIGFVLPASGDGTPIIVKFYRDAMVLSLVALLLGMLVRLVSESQQQAPVWVTKGATWLRSTRVINCMLMEREPDTILQEENPLPPRVKDPNEAPWHVYAQLFDRLSFLILLIVHLVLLVALLP